MAENKASAFGTISWYLIARDGHLSARVHPGMCLGEDDGGELSLKREHALLKLDIEDGRLQLELLSERHELLVPGEGGQQTLTVSPQTQVSIHLPNNLLSVDTNFATDNPFSEVLELEVVEIPVVGSVDARPPRGPASAEAHEPPGDAVAEPAMPFELLGDESVADEEVGPVAESVADEEDHDAATALHASVARLQEEHERAALDKRPQAPEPLVRLRRKLGEPRRASLLFLAAVAAGFLLLFLQSRPEPRVASAPSTPAVAEQSPAQQASSTPAPAAEPEEAAGGMQAEDAEIAVGMPGAAAADPAATPEATSVSPAAPAQTAELVEAVPLEADGAEPAADVAQSGPPAAAASPESSALLANVTALLAGDELPPKATLDFAVQTLKALRVAYPQDPAVRESLEALTLRLTEEARLSFERGELLSAGRLIEQASSTGVAQEAVASTVAFLETPAPVAAATEAAPAVSEEAAPQAPVEATELPDTEVAAARDALEAPAEQGTIDPEPVPAPDSSEAQTPDAVAESETTEALTLELVAAEPAVTEQGAAEAAAAETSAEAFEVAPQAGTPELAGLELPAADTASDREAPGADLDVMPVAELERYSGDTLTGALPPAADVDPLAPGPEYTGADGAASDAFVSTIAGADAELAALDEALGIVTSLPPAPAAAATEVNELYPFSRLEAVRVEPPRYPRRALDGVDGSIDLELTVNTRGRVEDVEVLSGGPSYFERAALRAVRSWRFEPVLRRGEAVPVRTRVRLTFDG